MALDIGPASATLLVTPINDELVKTVAAMPQIARVEARSEIIGRFQIAPGEWRELWLYVVPDFNNIQVDKFTPEQGAWPPGTGEIDGLRAAWPGRHFDAKNRLPRLWAAHNSAFQCDSDLPGNRRPRSHVRRNGPVPGRLLLVPSIACIAP